LGDAFDVDPNNVNKIFVAGTKWTSSKNLIVLQKTTNGGTNWNTYNVTSKNSYCYSLAVDPDNSDKIYVGGYLDEGSRIGVIFKSTNGGSTWTELGTNVFGKYYYVFAIAIDPFSTNTLYAGSYNGLYKSLNGGLDWTKISDRAAYCIKIHPKFSKKIFYGSSNGVYYSPDTGSTWGLIKAGLKVTEIGCLEIDSKAKYLFAGTRGSSVARYLTKKMKSPKKPKQLKAKALANREIKLTWKDTATNEEGFIIERSQGTSSNWSEIGRAGPNEKSYTDTVYSSNTLFQYRIRSYNAFGQSGYSNIVKVTSK